MTTIVNCYWNRCANRARCDAHGSCVANAQAGGKTFPDPLPPYVVALAARYTRHAAELIDAFAAAGVEPDKIAAARAAHANLIERIVDLAGPRKATQ